MVTRNRRELGKEVLTFVDGETKEVTIHAVANFEKMRLRRQFRNITTDKKGKIEKTEFEDEEYTLAILKLSMGVQVSREDLEDAETDLTELYRKYFPDTLDSKKNLKSSDMSKQNQDKSSTA